MTVESWDPSRPSAALTASILERLLTAAGRDAVESGASGAGLDAEAAAELAPAARHDPAAGADWAAAAAPLEDGQIIALIRLFTLGEAHWSGWKAGDASPVIPLAAELRRRGSYPADLTTWIRAHSDNRFLPYGNLMARL